MIVVVVTMLLFCPMVVAGSVKGSDVGGRDLLYVEE